MNKIFIYKNKPEQKDYKIAIEEANSWQFNIASFENIKQFEFFRQTLGFKIKLKQILYENTEKEVKIYWTNYNIVSSSFWSLEELPKKAKPIKALSNGSIVTCYYNKNYKSKTITIYRPNPNAKNIYDPLELQEHISHTKIYGLY